MIPRTYWMDAALKCMQIQSLGNKFVNTILFQLWLENIKISLRGSLMQGFFLDHLQQIPQFSQNYDLNRISNTYYLYILPIASSKQLFKELLRQLREKKIVEMEMIKLTSWSDNTTEMQLWGKGVNQRAISIEMKDQTSLFRSTMQKPIWKLES